MLKKTLGNRALEVVLQLNEIHLDPGKLIMRPSISCECQMTDHRVLKRIYFVIGTAARAVNFSETDHQCFVFHLNYFMTEILFYLWADDHLPSGHLSLN